MESVIRRNDIGAWSRAPPAILGSPPDGPLLLADSDHHAQRRAWELAKASAHQEQPNVHIRLRLSANYTRIGCGSVQTPPVVVIDGFGAAQVVSDDALRFRMGACRAAIRYQLTSLWNLRAGGRVRPFAQASQFSHSTFVSRRSKRRRMT
jgi:hypothetical protein